MFCFQSGIYWDDRMFGGQRYPWDSRVFCVSQWFIRMIVCSVVRDFLRDNTVFCGQSMVH